MFIKEYWLFKIKELDKFFLGYLMSTVAPV